MWYTPLIWHLRGRDQRSSESEASLVDTVSSKPAWLHSETLSQMDTYNCFFLELVPIVCMQVFTHTHCSACMWSDSYPTPTITQTYTDIDTHTYGDTQVDTHCDTYIDTHASCFRRPPFIKVWQGHQQKAKAFTSAMQFSYLGLSLVSLPRF